VVSLGPDGRGGDPSQASPVGIGDRSSPLVADPRLEYPPLPPHHVPRPRLMAALDEAADVPLTVLAAGAGYGKTVVLSEWAATTQDPVIWMAPSPADWQADRFLRLLKGGLRRLGNPGLEMASQLPASDRALDGVEFALSLAGALTPGTRLTLVIDNSDTIKAPEILSFLDGLVAAGDNGIRLVLSDRSDPLLPLHRYRLAGRIRELRASELAMTPAEAEALLLSHHVDLQRDSLRDLMARTEGWAAGIKLAALRMQGSERPDDFVTELALDQGSTGEYLLEEVFSQQPLEVRQMLVRTSFLEVVSGPIASAVTGIPGCGEMLADLARSNSFVVAIDHTFSHFRYHALFREFLRYMLAQETEPDLATLAGAGADWSQKEGDVLGAMSLVVRGGAYGRIADLLCHGGLAAAFAAHVDLTSWAALVPAPAALDAVAAFAVHSVMASSEEAKRAIRQSHPPPEMEADPQLFTTWVLAEIILAQKAGDAAMVYSSATRLLERDDSTREFVGGSLRRSLLLAAAGAKFWLGRIDQALTIVSKCLEECAQVKDRPVEAEALGLKALMDIYSGRTHQGGTEVARAESLVEEEGIEPPVALGLARGLRALVAAKIDDADEAFRQIRSSQVLGVDPGFKALQLCCQAAILDLRHLDAQARSVLQNPGLILSLPLIHVHRDVLCASIEIAAGRPALALEMLMDYPSGPELATERGDDGMPGVAAPTKAYAHAALGQLREAEMCIGAVFTYARPEVWRYQFIEATVCAALIAQQQGREGRAAELLARALEIADRDLTLPLVMKSAVVGPLVARHPAVASQWPAALPMTESTSASASPALDGWIPEQLTIRERSVLRLLATSMSTMEIAEEMCVSVNTVKTHVAAIYRKLATTKRRETILRAREYELL
jgi:LuxR family transcriptional regulator, maltose regulon positive regulatory protein